MREKMSTKQKLEFHRSLASRMRKFTGVNRNYDPNDNMKKFLDKRRFRAVLQEENLDGTLENKTENPSITISSVSE